MSGDAFDQPDLLNDGPATSEADRTTRVAVAGRAD